MKWLALLLCVTTIPAACSRKTKTEEANAETVRIMIQDYRLSHEPIVDGPAYAPPSTVKIGKTTYKVVFTAPMFLMNEGVYAYSTYSYLPNQIVLDPTNTLAELQENLIHELLHCMLHEGGGYNRETNNTGMSDGHAWIRPIVPVLGQVLKDNPELVKWLQEAR